MVPVCKSSNWCHNQGINSLFALTSSLQWRVWCNTLPSQRDDHSPDAHKWEGLEVKGYRDSWESLSPSLEGLFWMLPGNGRKKNEFVIRFEEVYRVSTPDFILVDIILQCFCHGGPQSSTLWMLALETIQTQKSCSTNLTWWVWKFWEFTHWGVASSKKCF